MKIRHLNSYFFSNRLHKVLVEKMAHSGISQEAFVPLPIGDDSKENPAEKIVYHVKPCFTKLERRIWPLKMARLWSVYKKTFGDTIPDMNHAHSLFVNGLVAYLAKKKQGVPYIVTVRNTDINFFLGRHPSFFRPIGWRILRESDAVVTLSNVYRSQLEKIYRNYPLKASCHLATIPNGCEDFWFEDRPSPRTAPACPLRLVFVGLLSRNKNLPAVLRALKILLQLGVPVELKVVGSGPLESQYQEDAKNLPVEFLGFVNDRHQLRQIYRLSDVLVVPSFTESFGIVYAEALSQGIPVIYTRNQGFDGFFKDGMVGHAVDPNNPEQIADAILDIRDHFDDMSRTAIAESPMFRWDHSIIALRELYEAAKGSV